MPDGVDTAAFSKWLPQEIEQDQRLIAPVWIVRSFESCWKCHQDTPVYCLRAAVVNYDEDDGEPELEPITNGDGINLMDVEALDPRIEAMLASYAPGYFLDFSKTQERSVYMNHYVHCRAKQGEFFLHNEPDGAFFPMDEEAEARISQTEIFSEGEFSFIGSYTLKG